MRTTTFLLAAVVVATLLAACGSTEPGAGGSLTGVTWQLTGGTVDGAPLDPIASAPATLTFDREGRVGGVAACNQYGGAVTVDGSDVSFPQGFDQTEMACLDAGVMELESAFLGALARVNGLTAGADTLVMTGPGVELRFEPQPPEPDAALIGTRWEMETLVAGETASTPVVPASIEFLADGTVTGHGGCNGFGGSYDAGTGFGQMVSTLMACEEPIMDQEQFILQVLSPEATVSIEGQVLTIADLSGNALVFRTAE